jgi:HYDIN/CFA65/VesB-like, Ig-like domain
MFLLKPTRSALAGSLLVTSMILATAILAGRSAVSADSGAVLNLKPETHDFGKVTATKDSTPLIVTVTNKSSSAVTFTSIVAAEAFLIQSDKCSDAPLAPGGSCKVEVVFHPLVTGPVSEKQALTFTDSAQNSPQQVELDGQGVFGSWL